MSNIRDHPDNIIRVIGDIYIVVGDVVNKELNLRNLIKGNNVSLLVALEVVRN